MSTTAEGTTPTVNDGTGAGLIAFLGWTIDKNELVDATASALRTGCMKVLSAEDDWQSLALHTVDLDAIVNRFKIKHRGDMKDRTREQYEQRFRQSVEMYLKWLDDDPTWKPSQRRKVSTGNGGAAPRKAAPAPTPAPAAIQPEVHTVPEPHQPGMISYPFPIRPGLQGTIKLPEDLTMKEAKRITAFITTLAFDEDPVPLALEARRSDVEAD